MIPKKPNWQFPVLHSHGAKAGQVRFIPYRFTPEQLQQAEFNHHQTMERLAARGGLSPIELRAVLECKDVKTMFPARNEEWEKASYDAEEFIKVMFKGEWS